MVIVKEDAYDKFNVFKDECTANPTWQMTDRICKQYGYNFSPYACVIVDKFGKERLDSIEIWTNSEILPQVEIKVRNNTLDYTIHHNVNNTFSVIEYEEYVEGLQGLVKLMAELNEIDFFDLFKYKE